VVSGEYSYLKLEAGGGMMPLSVERIWGERISVMHTYTMNGDLMYDPMMSFRIDNDSKMLIPDEFQQSMPPIYQKIDEHGKGQSVDGNGNERTVMNLQKELNSFTAQWLENISNQGYAPVLGNMEIDGDDVRITFDENGNPIIPKPEKEYDLGFGSMGYGTTVWNRAEEKDGDYVTVAHIAPNRSVTIYDKNMPEEVRQNIESKAQSLEPSLTSGINPSSEPPQFSNSIGYDLTDPEPSLGLVEMNHYGYKQNEMLPMQQHRALKLFDADHTIYLLYPDNTEALALVRDEIAAHDGLFGIEKEEWEASQELATLKASLKHSEGSLEADLLYGVGNKFGIYQVSDDLNSQDRRNIRFVPLDELKTLGLDVTKNNYKLIYGAPFTIKMEQSDSIQSILNQLYERFNTDQPDNFTGHSLSVSDIIVLKHNGGVSSHFVDKAGFMELENFLGEERQAIGEPTKTQQIKKPTLMERLEAGKQRAAQDGQIKATTPNDISIKSTESVV